MYSYTFTMQQVFSLLVFSLIHFVRGVEYSDNDPYAWGDTWPICNGQRQSPIDIRTCDAITKQPDTEFNFRNFDVNLSNVDVYNNGHYVTMTIYPNETNPPIISGSFLNDTYIFFEMHFHWQSQHTINGHHTPLELQMRFYRSAYDNSNNATLHSDGLINFVIFYANDFVPNTHLQIIVDQIDRITVANTNVIVDSFPALENFIPDNMETYFIYDGSLTHPDCSEYITWYVFPFPVYGSAYQFDAFQQILNIDGEPILDNERPTQPLYGRTIIKTELDYLYIAAKTQLKN